MFSSKEQLQNWIADRLRASGYRPQLEVVTHTRHKTRADIVCGDTVIECKKILDRDAMHQAASQAAMYAHHLGKSKKVIVGMPPFNASAQSSAKSAAAAIMSADANLSVYWVNQSGMFPVEQHRGSVLDKVSAPVHQPVPVSIPDPVIPQKPVYKPVRSSPLRPVVSTISLWRLIGAAVYVAVGAYFGGLLGAACGGLGGFWLITSK